MPRGRSRAVRGGSLVLAHHRHNVCGTASEAERAAGHNRADGDQNEGDEEHHPTAAGQRGTTAGGAARAGPPDLRQHHHQEKTLTNDVKKRRTKDA